MQHRDTGITDQSGQVVRFLMAARARHDQFGTGEQRQEKLPDRHVEAERGLLQHPVAGVDAVFVASPEQAVDHAQVFVHYAFRHAGGTRGVEHIGQVGRQQAQGPGVRVAGGLRGQMRAVVGVVEDQHRHVQRRQVVEQLMGGEYGPWRAVAEHIGLASVRQVRIDRHIGTAGLENPQQGDDHFRAASQAYGDPGIRFHSQFDQAVGELVGLAVELCIAEQRPCVAAHGTGVRALGGLLFDQLVNQHVLGIGARGVVEIDQQVLALALAHQREVCEGGVLLLQHRCEHREEALLYLLGFFGAEIGGVEVEIQVHVFSGMVIANEDRHGRLLVAVVDHDHPRRDAAAECRIAVEVFERQRYVEQLAPPGLCQAQAAIEFGDGEALMAIATT